MKLRHISSSIICFLLFEFKLIGALAPLSTRRDWWKKSLQTATAAAVVVSSTAAANNAAAATATQTTALVMGKEDIMTPKSHGTSEFPVQSKLQYGVNVELADRICNFNRRFAEPAGYFESTNLIERMVSSRSEDPVTFYDSVTGKPLFVAPIGRTANEFVAESRVHGWPSFRDAEVVWENVRMLKDGETVSTTGTHLGHNLPDRAGNRYCINLVSIAGFPKE